MMPSPSLVAISIVILVATFKTLKKVLNNTSQKSKQSTKTILK